MKKRMTVSLNYNEENTHAMDDEGGLTVHKSTLITRYHEWTY